MAINVISEEKVNVDVSCGEHTPEGRIIGNMHYTGLLEQILSRDEYSGCPHDGMRHTLRLHMKKEDIVSMLMIIDEHYSEQSSVWVEYAQAFITHVERKLEEVQ